MDVAGLNEAIVVATWAHVTQVDKAGQPYILHPLRVMLSMDTDEERMVAALHDVVEDTDVTLAKLRQAGFAEDVTSAVDALTRRDGEPYMPDYIDRVAANPLARKVKLADLADNLSPSRALPGSEAVRLYRRYRAAQARLEVL